MGGGSDATSDDGLFLRDAGAVQQQQQCLGLARATGQRCRISWDLDARGFCRFHAPNAPQCRGIARTTGQRCRIAWNLNAHGYCHHHAAASVANTRQCAAVARTTGQRCRIATGIDASGFCSVHQRRQPSTESATSRRCRGLVFHTGEPCRNDAKPDYAYCCAAHDPSHAYVSPRLFDASDRPRALLERDVVQFYDGKDLYHRDQLDLTVPGLLELDHILEKQCFSFAFQRIDFRDRADDSAYLAAVVRDNVANELTNLCLTRTATNKIKGAAVWKFLDDSLTGHVAARASTFTNYMLAESRDGTRLGRNTTRAIVREMGRTLKECQFKLAGEGETPLIDTLSTQLQQLFVMMDLHVATSVRDKWALDGRPVDSLTADRAEKKREPSVERSPAAAPPPLRVVPVGKTKSLADAVNAKPFVPGQTVNSGTAVATCRGVTKRGTPCAISWGLDPRGFCPYHIPAAPQCLGLARSTGQRCRITWGLDARGYCQYHGGQ